MKLADVLVLHEGLTNLLTEEISVLLKFRIQTSIDATLPTVQRYNSCKDALINEHGKNGSITPKDDNWIKFIEAHNVLLLEDVEEPPKPTLALKDFDFNSKNNYNAVIQWLKL